MAAHKQSFVSALTDVQPGRGFVPPPRAAFTGFYRSTTLDCLDILGEWTSNNNPQLSQACIFHPGGAEGEEKSFLPQISDKEEAALSLSLL